jgi:hypothetical protein
MRCSMVVSHGDVMSIELLLVGQRIKVRLDGERDNRGRVVGQILLERLRVYAGSHVDCS